MRRWSWIPLLTLSAAFVPAGGEPPVPGLHVALLVAAFLAAEVLDRRPGIALLAACEAMIVVSEVIAGPPGNATWTAVALVLPAWLFGRLARGHRLRAEELRRLTAALERERAHVAELAAEAERARIARELHDSLSNGLSLMTLQASAADALLDGNPEAVCGLLESVREVGAAALHDLEGVLAGPGLETAPPLATLVEGMRASGLRVTLEVIGGIEGVPPAVDLATRRIVQEAATNVVRHAAATEVTIRVACDGPSVEVFVEDDGVGRALPAAVAGGGRGLVGMRERVEAFGGDLQAGPRPGGGFAVRARLQMGVT